MSTGYLEQILKFTASADSDAFLARYLFVPFGEDAWPPVSVGIHDGAGPRDRQLYCNREIYIGQPYLLSPAQQSEAESLRAELGDLVGLGFGLEGDRIRPHLEQAAEAGSGIAAEILSLLDGGAHPFDAQEEQAFFAALRGHVEPTLPIILESKEMSADGLYGRGRARIDCDSIEKTELIDPAHGALTRATRIITNLRGIQCDEADWTWSVAAEDDLGCAYFDSIRVDQTVVELDYVALGDALEFKDIRLDGDTLACGLDFEAMKETVEMALADL